MMYKLRALVCLCLLVMIMSCQKENYESQSLELSDELDINLRFSKINFNQVPKKNHDLLKSLVNGSAEFNSLREDSPSLSFLIDTSDITRFDAENQYTSYTFRVVNDESSNVLQNIVISEHAHDSTSIHLAEYTLDLTLGELAHRDASPHIVDSKFYLLDDPHSIIKTE